MLYCMALTSKEIERLNNEIHRVLKPGGINIYTVRHTKDGDFQKGIHRGEDIYENDGFGGLRGLHVKEIPMEDILFGIIENMSERCPTCTVQVGDD